MIDAEQINEQNPQSGKQQTNKNTFSGEVQLHLCSNLVQSVAVLEKRQKEQAGLLPELEGPEMEEFLLEVKRP